MSVIENPIINGPYQEPTAHWVIDQTTGQPTGERAPGRRQSQTWIPVPRSRKRGTVQQGDLFETLPLSESRNNDIIGEIRRVVGLWRQAGYPHVTPTTRRLLEYWTSPERGRRLFFAQLEAVETAIYLTEVRDKLGEHWISDHLASANADHNSGMPRVALKMATGAGKTVVIGMLIAWHTLNKAASPQDARFAKRFLLVAPGITIRDRLRVLMPSDDGNYYKQLDLVPADLWTVLRQAQVVIVNSHAFNLKTTKEGQSIASLTKKLLLAKSGTDEDPFTETPAMMVSRVLKDFGGKGQIVVINDEAHHCYQERSEPVDDGLTADHLTGDEKKEAQAENDGARRWFIGLQRIAAKVGIKTIYDLSATPQFLKGSGYPEGLLFPWVVSDFSLMDAIESGLVKIPRVPVDDDAPGNEVAYLNLWANIQPMPKRAPKEGLLARQPLPATLDAALKSLYGNYTKAFDKWEHSVDRDDTTPPVFIVVCNSILTSEWLYSKIAGHPVEDDAGRVQYADGELPLFSNVEHGQPLARLRTIIVDSKQWESDTPQISADFKAAAAEEIERFRTEYAARYPGRDGSDLTDGDLLREVLNTVGKKGKLGEHVRCVVSVSMLTEGWDANTVTHILGVRAFGSQLLCEQVVGRGLRRTSYAINEHGLLEPEYADVYGVPFSFVQTDPNRVMDPKPRPIPKRIRAVPDRIAQRISFPRLEGYRVEIEDPQFHTQFDTADKFVIDANVAHATTMAGVIGTEEAHALDYAGTREQEVAFELAGHLLETFRDPTGARKPWLFPSLVTIAREWLQTCVIGDSKAIGMLKHNAEWRHRAVEAIHRALSVQAHDRAARVLPIFHRYEPQGSTDDVDFYTIKTVIEPSPDKCPVNYVVLDGIDGNTWERDLAYLLDSNADIEAYVKNDHLEFAIPYLYAGRSHRYLPDFIARMQRRNPDEPQCHLIIEVSGSLKSQGSAQAKAQSARLWCKAVNGYNKSDRWGYVEMRDPKLFHQALVAAIAALYGDDDVITGRAEVALNLQFDPGEESLFADIFASKVPSQPEEAR